MTEGLRDGVRPTDLLLAPRPEFQASVSFGCDGFRLRVGWPRPGEGTTGNHKDQG